MNTMVGMQASHHTPVGEDLSELAKNENDPLSINGMEDEVDVFDDDDFDPEELLKSPLFNDSQGRMSASISNEAGFGTFSGDSGHEPNNVTPDNSDDFIAINSPQRAEYADFKRSSLLQPPANAFQERFNIDQAPLASPMKAAATAAAQQNYPAPMKPPPRPQFMPDSDNYDVLAHQSVAHKHPSMDESMGSHYTCMDESMNSTYRPDPQENAREIQQCAMQRGVPQQSSTYADPPPMRSVPERSHSFQQQHSAMFARAPPGRSHSCHVSSNSSGLNQLQQMQQIQRKEGLSVSVHGESMRGGNFNGMLGGPVHGGDSLSHSMHARSGPPPFLGLQSQGNMPITSDMQNNKETPASLNQAMEKLCESMKRSAMSRNLVKQYSGRSLVQAQSSGLMMGKQNSNRNLMGRQGSLRNLMDDGSGRGTPTSVMHRMSNPKHRLQHPVRGLYRHDSQQSLNGQSNHGISLQIDGRNMGKF